MLGSRAAALEGRHPFVASAAALLALTNWVRRRLCSRACWVSPKATLSWHSASQMVWPCRVVTITASCRRWGRTWPPHFLPGVLGQIGVVIAVVATGDGAAGFEPDGAVLADAGGLGLQHHHHQLLAAGLAHGGLGIALGQSAWSKLMTPRQASVWRPSLALYIATPSATMRRKSSALATCSP